MRSHHLILAAASALSLAACGGGAGTAGNAAGGNETAMDGLTDTNAAMTNDSAAGVTTATANVRLADGREAGTATAVAENGGVSVRFTGMNLPAGTRAVHVHTTGRCDPPGFETAGSHWNPTNREHGRENPQGAHAGDMPNLTVAAEGTGTVSFASTGAAMASLLDADGAAFVVHADPDDYRTDPSGNAGGRIACGVFNAG